jgi:hypothetical protein
VVVHGKGGKVVVMPLGFDDLKADLELYLLDRDPAEYLLYPKNDPITMGALAIVALTLVVRLAATYLFAITHENLGEERPDVRGQ